MNNFLACVLFLSLSNSSLALSETTLKARSIAEHCQYLYQIETEFRLSTSEKNVTAVKVWLFDLYTEIFLEPQIFATSVEGDLTKASIDINTLSTNPKYLAHDIFFSFVKTSEEMPARPSFKAKFSQLMNRCYDRAHRDLAPFANLEIENAQESELMGQTSLLFTDRL